MSSKSSDLKNSGPIDPKRQSDDLLIEAAKPLRAVLFDLDDTLHDKSKTVRAFAADQHASARLAEFGVDREAWVASCVEFNNLRIEKSKVFSNLGKLYGLPDSVSIQLLEDFDARLGTFAIAVPGALDLLVQCRNHGLKAAIVTNGRDKFQRGKITALGLDSLIDAVFTSEAFGSKKPDHRIFLGCLDALDVEPSEAAFVGNDFADDIEPALALGMTAIWRTDRSSTLVPFSGSLEEILRYLFPQFGQISEDRLQSGGTD